LTGYNFTSSIRTFTKYVVRISSGNLYIKLDPVPKPKTKPKPKPKKLKTKILNLKSKDKLRTQKPSTMPFK